MHQLYQKHQCCCCGCTHRARVASAICVPYCQEVPVGWCIHAAWCAPEGASPGQGSALGSQKLSSSTQLAQVLPSTCIHMWMADMAAENFQDVYQVLHSSITHTCTMLSWRMMYALPCSILPSRPSARLPRRAAQTCCLPQLMLPSYDSHRLAYKLLMNIARRLEIKFCREIQARTEYKVGLAEKDAAARASLQACIF